MFNTKIRTTLALALAAVTVSTGLAAAPADAAIGSMTAQLSISRSPGSAGAYSVRVSGLIRMPQAEAQQLVANDARVVWRMWGSDTFDDDFLFGPDPASVNVTSEGIRYEGSRVAARGLLNEDDCCGDYGDEVYAGVRLLSRHNGPTLKSRESNHVHARF